MKLTKSAQNTVLRLQIELTKSAQNTVLRLQIELTKSVTYTYGKATLTRFEEIFEEFQTYAMIPERIQLGEGYADSN
ncbi:hypothetical protein E3V59_00440 [Streptococcus pseudopneumoniae]|uniref:hypothetical protein n=1 Tax=Streptococcus pseudopneumoniae TaxID=257758 RepID=UPI00110C27B1|nr:hypothetical protein [Streptococcus pseudopneumoniae]TMR76113.1 hypothetical protein E3V59_00440 [Streptococcus pseudopneumoniae]